MKNELTPIEVIVATPNVEIDSYMTGVLQTTYGHNVSELKAACYAALRKHNGDRDKAEREVFDEFVKSSIAYRITVESGSFLQRDVAAAMDEAVK